VARLRITMQQDHRVPCTRDEIVQTDAIDSRKTTLDRLRGFNASHLLVMWQDTVYMTRSYPGNRPRVRDLGVTIREFSFFVTFNLA
jgi:hypothetical protein